VPKKVYFKLKLPPGASQIILSFSYILPEKWQYEYSCKNSFIYQLSLNMSFPLGMINDISYQYILPTYLNLYTPY